MESLETAVAGMPLLRKPFREAELSVAVRRSLESPQD
jgi:hypothetical protein